MKQSALLRKIRLDKQVTQKQLTQGICSRSSLATFESSKTANCLSSEFLLLFLDRLNVPVDEFVFHMQMNSEKNACLDQLSSYIKQRPMGEELRLLAERCYEKYDQSGDVFWLCYGFKASEMYQQQHRDPFCYQEFKAEMAADLQVLQDYLISVQNWGSFEFRVFGNIIQYLPTTYITTIFESLPEKIDLAYPPNRTLFLNLIVNMEIHFIEIGDFIAIRKILHESSPYFSYKNLHFKIISRFIGDLLVELETDQHTIKRYRYLKIYQEMGFDGYYETLMNFRQRQLKHHSD
ncbi:hypothetical protein [Schleiferilactobacillus perolens]|uniref:HTH cro/C1-type domain-containing protein n=1 Tax=Schleiferilactobacillus perolens DSM 12744 TaxID=1423792 RepID=A0A0R1MLX1_9LACO|nr:hypothetical protein [Schleiferilactobacillus perolens]KRL08895.1 hypothetical protein FD09_GL001148 [Schleiferilactobacillus perolens DSM 12744]